MITQEALLSYLAHSNSDNFNYNKALEEAIEFQEVIVKMQTKIPERQPDPKELIKEYGDFVYRGLIAILTKFPEMTVKEAQQQVEKHIEMKLGRLEVYRKEGKYKGGL